MFINALFKIDIHVQCLAESKTKLKLYFNLSITLDEKIREQEVF